MPDRLGRLTEVIAGDERRPVGRGDELVLREPFGDPFDRRLDRTGVHERHETEGEEVLRPLGVARLDAERLAHLLGERRHRHLDQPVRRQAAVVERVRRVLGLLEVALVERVLVDDQRSALLEPVEVGLERRRVHRHEHVGLVARRGDLVIGDVHLEARHAVDGAGRCTDLGREVGHRRQVVAERRAHRGESVTRELHPIAGVSCEPDHQAMENFGTVRSFDRVGHVPLLAPATLPGRQLTFTLPPLGRKNRDVLFVELANCSAQVAATSKRNDKIALLADVLRRLAPDEVAAGRRLPRRRHAARSVRRRMGDDRRRPPGPGGRSPRSACSTSRRRSNGWPRRPARDRRANVAGSCATCSNGPPSRSNGWCSASSAASCARARSTA